MKVRSIVWILLFVLTIGLVASYVVADNLFRTSYSAVPSPPKALRAKRISFPGKTGQSLSGWFAKGDNTKGGVLLMHRLRSNRLEMLDRAIFLNAVGYSVLLFDFRGHGESPGDYPTFGFLEAGDAESAFEYLEDRLSVKSVGVIGMSLGGVAAVLGDVSRKADAMVLEAVYTTFVESIENRMAIYLGYLGRTLSPLLLWQIQPRWGFDPDQLSPINEIRNTRAAVLVIAGASDRRTTLEDSKRLFQMAPEPKEFWAIEDARHENYYQFSPAEYKQRILAFFAQHLKAR